MSWWHSRDETTTTVPNMRACRHSILETRDARVHLLCVEGFSILRDIVLVQVHGAWHTFGADAKVAVCKILRTSHENSPRPVVEFVAQINYSFLYEGEKPSVTGFMKCANCA